MEHYTSHKDEKIDEVIKEDLSKIRNAVLYNFPDTKGLILEGGFGRGEGSVLIRNRIIKPINDYDLVIITDKEVNSEKLTNLKETLTKAVNNYLKEYYLYVDFRNITTRQLERLPCTMHNYDLKYASSIIYGDKDILRRIPEMSAKEIPLLSVQKPLFLFSRAFLCHFSQDYLRRELSPREKFWLMHSCAKLIIGDITSLLILEGEYYPSHAERCKKFLKIFPQNGKLCKMGVEATNFKLMSTENISENVVDYWFETKEVHFNVLFYFMSELCKKEFHDIKEILKAYKKYNWMQGESKVVSKSFIEKSLELFNRYKPWEIYGTGLRNLLTKLRRAFIQHITDYGGKRLRLDSTVLILLASLRKDGVDQDLLKAASKELDIDSNDWEYVRKRYTEIEEPQYNMLREGKWTF